MLLHVMKNIGDNIRRWMLGCLFDWIFQIPDLDAILVPVSGGGMLAGVSAVAHLLQPKCQGEVQNQHFWEFKAVDLTGNSINL